MKKITVAASKSYLQRALAIAALAEGESVLKQVSWCNDSVAAKRIIEDLGCQTTEENRNLLIKSSNINFKTNSFTAGEAGLSIRMFSPIFALYNQEINFTGEGSLKTRPIQIIEDALVQLGVAIESNNGLLPLKIQGPIKAGNINIDGSLSSQLLTGLLMALPLVDGDSVIEVSHLKSIPYIDMTLSIMKHFGVEIQNEDYKIFRVKGNQKYKAKPFNIEGDWSGGAFFLVYGAVKENIEIANLNGISKQADKAIVEALQLAGARVVLRHNLVIVEKSELTAFDFNATNCPDLFPPLVCLASQCKGVTKLKGVSRLKHKESDRAVVLKEEFNKIGIKVELQGDDMYITGAQPKAGIINSHNDHRIAMVGGLMNLFCQEEIKVEGKSSVNKSYPEFFADLGALEKRLEKK